MSRRLLLLLVLLLVVVSGCKPSGERRLVSLREGDLPEDVLHGEVAYVETLGVRRSALYVHDMAEDDRERIVIPDGYANAPAWSPDGQRLAFSLTEDDGYTHLWVVDRDGSGLRQLTEGEVVDDNPRWSPDGRELVFSSIRDGDYDWRLFRLEVDGGGGPEPITGDGDHSVYPDWSPDGRSIVYSDLQDGQYDLVLRDLGSGREERLTSGSGDDIFARFSPDGREIIYSSDIEDDVWQLYRVGVDGDGEHERVIGSDSMDQHPDYSPDMQHIVFSAGYLAIYRADGRGFDDGKLRYRLTRNLAWSPDWRIDDG